MAQSFSTVVKAYQDEMKYLPFVPKGSFGRSLVGADGFPTIALWILGFGP
jgi:hypothetical protein